MKNTYFYIVATVSLVTTIISGIMENYQLMYSMGLLFITSIVFGNLDKLKKASVSKEGFEIVLKEAEEVIDELKNLAVSLVKPICSVIYTSNHAFSSFSLDDQLDYVNDLYNSLLEIGVNKENSNEAVENFYLWVQDSLKRHFLGKLQARFVKENSEIAESIGKIINNHEAQLEAVDKMLKKYSIKLDDTEKKLYENFNCFIRDKKIKHKD